MKTGIVIATLATLLSGAALTLSSQTVDPYSRRPRRNRVRMIMQLRQDLDAAVAHTNVSNKERKTLDKSSDALQKELEVRQEGGKMNRDKVRHALKDINKVFQKDQTFQPGDRQRIEQDVAQLDRLFPPRRYHPRRMRSPRRVWRPYPRYRTWPY